MNKYRIIEKLNTFSGTNEFYIQKKKRFLWWKYWTDLIHYDPIINASFVYSYDSIEEARSALKQLTNKPIIKIHCN
jgi:hypothetical protein